MVLDSPFNHVLRLGLSETGDHYFMQLLGLWPQQVHLLIVLSFS